MGLLSATVVFPGQDMANNYHRSCVQLGHVYPVVPAASHPVACHTCSPVSRTTEFSRRPLTPPAALAGISSFAYPAGYLTPAAFRLPLAAVISGSAAHKLRFCSS